MPGADLCRHASGMKNDTAGLRSAPPVLRTRGLRKEYGKGEGLVQALRGIDLDVAAGETLAIMGPSGCGKSTLLHLLGGLDRPSSGEAYLGGRRIDRMRERSLARVRRRDIGFVFQAFQLMDAADPAIEMARRRSSGNAARDGSIHRHSRPGRRPTAGSGDPSVRTHMRQHAAVRS